MTQRRINVVKCLKNQKSFSLQWTITGLFLFDNGAKIFYCQTSQRRSSTSTALPRQHHSHWTLVTSVLSSGFQPGFRTIFEGVTRRYFMHTAVLHFALFEFQVGSLGYSGLLYWVTVQKRLKTTALEEYFVATFFQLPSQPMTTI